MGHLCSACSSRDTQIVQELPQAVGFEGGTPVYWNNTVYFTGSGVPAAAYTLSNGTLVTPPVAQAATGAGGAHGLITANGTSEGIFWFLSGSTLSALDAHTLRTLYSSNQAANSRDKITPLAHFASPIAADGKVFVGTQNSLMVFGLLPSLSVAGGDGQSAAAGATLPLPLKVQAVDSYTQAVHSGVTVAFSDGGKGGTFNPATAVTDASGFAWTSYTLPVKAGVYNLTASATGYVTGPFTETATSSLPDLIESSVTNPPPTAVTGGTFSVTDSVKNTGNTAASGSTTRYYLSSTTSKNAASRLLTGTRAVASLNPGISSNGSVNVTVPAGTAAGTYFLLACADDTRLVPEIVETNNCTASTTRVTVSGPDLVETAVTNPPATANPGISFSVTDSAQNIGNATAPASTTRYYLSTTTSKSGARLLTGTRAVPSLSANATSSGSVTVTVSAGTADGTYFLLACADDTGAIRELLETNNCRASATRVTVSGPDLIETAVSNPPAATSPNITFAVTDTVQNVGNVTAGASTTRYFLSTTNTKTVSSIILAGNRTAPSLAPGAMSNGGASVTVPATLPHGTYFLLACSDDKKVVSETNEANNCKASAATTTY
jgi:hypothetical protein